MRANKILVFVLIFKVHIAIAQNSFDNNLITYFVGEDFYRDFCEKRVCVKKCCAQNEVIQKNDKSKLYECVRINSITNNPTFPKIDIYKSINQTSSNMTSDDIQFLKIYKEPENLIVYTAKDTKLLENGSTLLVKKNYTLNLQTLDYCVDYKYAKQSKSFKFCAGQLYSNDNTPDGIFKATYTTVGALISFIFLVLTLGVYIVLPQKREMRDLLLMTYLTVFATYEFLQAIQQILVSKKHVGYTFFLFYSPIVYYTMLASFFWLNIITIRSWYYITNSINYQLVIKPSYRSTLIKFWKYGIFGWGIPLLILVVALIVDNVNADKLPKYVTPMFRDAMVVGFNIFNYWVVIPIGISVAINFVCFILVLWHLINHRRSMNGISESGPNQESYVNNRQKIGARIYIKMAAVMGLNWILDVVVSSDVTVWLFILTTTYNLLSGVIIFYLFICKESTFKALCKQFKIQNRFTEALWPNLWPDTKKAGSRYSSVSVASKKKNSEKDRKKTDESMKSSQSASSKRLKEALSTTNESAV